MLCVVVTFCSQHQAHILVFFVVNNEHSIIGGVSLWNVGVCVYVRWLCANYGIYDLSIDKFTVRNGSFRMFPVWAFIVGIAMLQAI